MDHALTRFFHINLFAKGLISYKDSDRSLYIKLRCSLCSYGSLRLPPPHSGAASAQLSAVEILVVQPVTFGVASSYIS